MVYFKRSGEWSEYKKKVVLMEKELINRQKESADKEKGVERELKRRRRRSKARER